MIRQIRGMCRHPVVGGAAFSPHRPPNHPDIDIGAHRGPCYGCTQEEDIQGEKPQPSGVGLADSQPGAERMPPMRIRQASAQGVQGVRLVWRTRSRRGGIAADSFPVESVF